MKQVCQFDIKDLMPIGLTFVVLGIALSYGLSVMSDVRLDAGESSCASNTGVLGNMTGWNATDGTCYNISGVDKTGAHIVPTSAEYNGTVSSVQGVAKIPEKLPLIATVIVAVVIISILVRYLMVRF